MHDDIGYNFLLTYSGINFKEIIDKLDSNGYTNNLKISKEILCQQD